MFQVAQRPSQRSRSCLALALVALPVVDRDAFALHRHCRYPTNLLVKESFIAQQYPLATSSFSSALLSSTRSLQPRRVALRQESSSGAPRLSPDSLDEQSPSQSSPENVVS